MKRLEKLFEDIQNQLSNEKIKHGKLKICKYSFEISKVVILSISTGLCFTSIFATLSMILIPIIDTIKNNSNVDSRLNLTKLKKELMNYRSTTYKGLNEDEINHQYDKLTNKLSVINTF